MRQGGSAGTMQHGYISRKKKYLNFLATENPNKLKYVLFLLTHLWEFLHNFALKSTVLLFNMSFIPFLPQFQDKGR